MNKIKLMSIILSAATHCIFAGGLHDLAEADTHALPLVTLFWAQTFLQDGNDLRQDLLTQFPHQVTQSTSSDLEQDRGETQTINFNNTSKALLSVIQIYDEKKCNN